MDEYPQHKKAVLLHDKSVLLSEFLDWMEKEDFVIAKWVRYEDDTDYELDVSYESKESLIARFLGVDLKAFHAEKDAMLEEYRKLIRKECHQ